MYRMQREPSHKIHTLIISEEKTEKVYLKIGKFQQKFNGGVLNPTLVQLNDELETLFELQLFSRTMQL